MRITVQVTNNATDRLGRIGPNVRQALLAAARPLAQEVYSDVLGRAAGHIHTQGTKPGLYLASIAMGIYDKGQRLGGFVRSGSPLAHLLELGANPPAHSIEPEAAHALAFTGDVGMVFARSVQHPGARIPPYPAFQPAMEARKDEIRNALSEAMRKAAREA